MTDKPRRLSAAAKWLANAFDERDLTFVAGLALFGAGLLQVSFTLALLGVGSVLLFVALRR